MYCIIYVFFQIRVLEQEKKISGLEELNRNPEIEEMQGEEDENDKLQGLIKVSIYYTRCSITSTLCSLEARLKSNVYPILSSSSWGTRFKTWTVFKTCTGVGAVEFTAEKSNVRGTVTLSSILFHQDCFLVFHRWGLFTLFSFNGCESVN